MSVTTQFEEALFDWAHVFMRRSMQESTRWMTSKGLSRSQTGALMHLHFQGKCPITNIGEHLDVSTPAASQLVNRLVQSGLVERVDDPDDARVKQVVLSEAGKSLLDEGFQARKVWMLELSNFLTAQEQVHISEALHTLVEAATQTIKQQEPKNIVESSRHRLHI